MFLNFFLASFRVRIDSFSKGEIMKYNDFQAL